MKLTEDEVQEIIWDDHDNFETIEENEGEDRRWTRTNTVVVKHLPSGKYYMLEYEQGLTEMQENLYEAQEAYEVKKVTRTVPAKEVTSWETVSK